MNKLIYLASPYSSEYHDIIQRRIKQVQDATARLIELGHLIFSPIVHTHPIHDLVSFSSTNSDQEMSGWMAYDYAMIDKADEIWVLCLKDWHESRGVNAEMRYAFDQGKTVRLIQYPSLKGTADTDHVITPSIKAKSSLQTPATCTVDKFIKDTTSDGLNCDGYKEPMDLNSEASDVFGSMKVPRFGEPSITEKYLTRYWPTQVIAKTGIIGLNGHAQTGKDTIGNYLVREHGFTRVSFADAVRDCLYALNPLLDDEFTVKVIVDGFGWDYAKTKSYWADAIRELLQRMGTEVGREIISESIWIDIARRKCEGLSKIVFTDVRFPNEVALVKELGGTVVRVTREGVEAVNGHVSDQVLDDSLIDTTIHNRGIEKVDLYNQIERVLRYG